jgi:hypothetical protein
MSIDADKQVLTKLKEPFPADQIKSREGPKKNGQPTKFSYVATEHLQTRLEEVLGPQWDWTVISSSLQKVNKVKARWENNRKVGEDSVEVEQVIVHGRLTIHLPSGLIIHRDSFGGCDLNYGTTAGDPHKIADSNAFRKACDKLGLAREVGGEEFSSSNSSKASSAPFTNRFNNPSPNGPQPLGTVTHQTPQTQAVVNSGNPFTKR